MKLALNYTTVRFMPFAETSEFANVGVLAYAPKTGYLDFKLAPSRFKRVSDFFEDLNRRLYASAISTFKNELQYVKQVSNEMSGQQLHDFITEITRQREGIMTFGETSIMLTSNPEQSLEILFNRFISRNFTDSKEYREKQMISALRKNLSSQVNVKYKESSLDTSFSSFKLPFVAEALNHVKAIKPLAFDQKTPLLLADHGDRWISRIKHLINAEAIKKDDFLFTIEKPIKKKKEFLKAFEIVELGMNDLGVKVIPFENTNNIMEFAQFDVDGMVGDYKLTH